MSMNRGQNVHISDFITLKTKQKSHHRYHNNSHILGEHSRSTRRNGKKMVTKLKSISQFYNLINHKSNRRNASGEKRDASMWFDSNYYPGDVIGTRAPLIQPLLKCGNIMGKEPKQIDEEFHKRNNTNTQDNVKKKEYTNRSSEYNTYINEEHLKENAPLSMLMKRGHIKKKRHGKPFVRKKYYGRSKRDVHTILVRDDDDMYTSSSQDVNKNISSTSKNGNITISGIEGGNDFNSTAGNKFDNVTNQTETENITSNYRNNNHYFNDSLFTTLLSPAESRENILQKNFNRSIQQLTTKSLEKDSGSGEPLYETKPITMEEEPLPSYALSPRSSKEQKESNNIVHNYIGNTRENISKLPFEEQHNVRNTLHHNVSIPIFSLVVGENSDVDIRNLPIVKTYLHQNESIPKFTPLINANQVTDKINYTIINIPGSTLNANKTIQYNNNVSNATVFLSPVQLPTLLSNNQRNRNISTESLFPTNQTLTANLLTSGEDESHYLHKAHPVPSDIIGELNSAYTGRVADNNVHHYDVMDLSGLRPNRSNYGSTNDLLPIYAVSPRSSDSNNAEIAHSNSTKSHSRNTEPINKTKLRESDELPFSKAPKTTTDKENKEDDEEKDNNHKNRSLPLYSLHPKQSEDSQRNEATKVHASNTSLISSEQNDIIPTSEKFNETKSLSSNISEDNQYVGVGNTQVLSYTDLKEKNLHSISSTSLFAGAPKEEVENLVSIRKNKPLTVDKVITVTTNTDDNHGVDRAPVKPVKKSFSAIRTNDHWANVTHLITPSTSSFSSDGKVSLYDAVYSSKENEVIKDKSIAILGEMLPNANLTQSYTENNGSSSAREGNKFPNMEKSIEKKDNKINTEFQDALHTPSTKEGKKVTRGFQDVTHPVDLDVDRVSNLHDKVIPSNATSDQDDEIDDSLQSESKSKPIKSNSNNITSKAKLFLNDTLKEEDPKFNSVRTSSRNHQLAEKHDVLLNPSPDNDNDNDDIVDHNEIKEKNIARIASVPKLENVTNPRSIDSTREKQNSEKLIVKINRSKVSNNKVVLNQPKNSNVLLPTPRSKSSDEIIKVDGSGMNPLMLPSSDKVGSDHNVQPLAKESNKKIKNENPQEDQKDDHLLSFKLQAKIPGKDNTGPNLAKMYQKGDILRKYIQNDTNARQNISSTQYEDILMNSLERESNPFGELQENKPGSTKDSIYPMTPFSPMTSSPSDSLDTLFPLLFSDENIANANANDMANMNAITNSNTNDNAYANLANLVEYKAQPQAADTRDPTPGFPASVYHGAGKKEINPIESLFASSEAFSPTISPDTMPEPTTEPTPEPKFDIVNYPELRPYIMGPYNDSTTTPPTTQSSGASPGLSTMADTQNTNEYNNKNPLDDLFSSTESSPTKAAVDASHLPIFHNTSTQSADPTNDSFFPPDLSTPSDSPYILPTPRNPTYTTPAELNTGWPPSEDLIEPSLTADESEAASQTVSPIGYFPGVINESSSLDAPSAKQEPYLNNQTYNGMPSIEPQRETLLPKETKVENFTKAMEAFPEFFTPTIETKPENMSIPIEAKPDILQQTVAPTVNNSPLPEYKPQMLSPPVEAKPEIVPTQVVAKPEMIPTAPEFKPEVLQPLLETKPEGLPPLTDTRPETLLPIIPPNIENITPPIIAKPGTLPPLAGVKPENFSSGEPPIAYLPDYPINPLTDIKPDIPTNPIMEYKPPDVSNISPGLTNNQSYDMAQDIQNAIAVQQELSVTKPTVPYTNGPSIGLDARPLLPPSPRPEIIPASRMCKPGPQRPFYTGKPNCLIIGDSIALRYANYYILIENPFHLCFHSCFVGYILCVV